MELNAKKGEGIQDEVDTRTDIQVIEEAERKARYVAEVRQNCINLLESL